MSFSIEQFKANLQYGVARPHSYRIILDNPVVADGGEVALMCENIELPGRGFATTPLQIYGPPRKLPYQDIYPDVNATFILSADMYERKFFDAWQKEVSDARNYYIEYHDGYARNLVVQKLTDFDGGVYVDYTSVMVDAWPSVVNPTVLSYKDTNSYATMTVTFSYYKWLTPEDLSSDSGGSGVEVTREPYDGKTPDLPQAPNNPEIP